jgi:hypothetical protein
MRTKIPAALGENAPRTRPRPRALSDSEVPNGGAPGSDDLPRPEGLESGPRPEGLKSGHVVLIRLTLKESDDVTAKAT